MTKSEYFQIYPDLRYVADRLEQSKIPYQVENHGICFRATDLDGIQHSYYPTTGTIVLRKFLKVGSKAIRKNPVSLTLRRRDLENFIYFLENPQEVNEQFRKDLKRRLCKR